MTLSAELEQRYTSEVDVDWWEALILSHSQFPQTYYLTNYHSAQQGTIDGALRTFQPVPFQIVLPSRDDGGRGDMGVAIGAIGNAITEAVDAAIEVPTERILAQYTVFILGNTEPQRTPPIELSLTGIVITESQITASATPSDTLNAPFPRVLYRPDTFPGLARR